MPSRLSLPSTTSNFRKGGIVRLRLLPNQAKPLPPVSVTLGQKHIDVQQFCTRFNQLPLPPSDVPINILLRLHGRTSFDIISKAPTISQMVKSLLNISKFPQPPCKPPKLSLSRADVMHLALAKSKDCNTSNLFSIAKSIFGTLASMGITSHSNVER
ncbi:MAG: hypothetical protein ACTS4U_01515 [Candidatus Hodgkinia cicadicola]